MRDEVILFYCNQKECFGMDTTNEEVLGKIITLCQDHAKQFKDILEDIIVSGDKEFMAEWAHDNLKPEVADKWD